MSKKPAFDTDRFANVLPSPTPEEITQLRKLLEAYGCRDPLILASLKTENGTLFLCDGFNRYGLCDELGIGFKTITLEFADDAEVIHWMHDNQAGRRNWSQSQEAMVAAKWREAVSRGNKEGEKPTIRETAEKFGVNVSDMHAAAVVQSSGSAALQREAESGNVPIRKAAAIAATVPKREQCEAIREGIEVDKSDDKSPEVIRDELGKKVPDELREAFKACAIFDQLMIDIRTFKTTLNPVIGDPQDNRQPQAGYEFLARERQELFRHIDQVREFLKFGRPYAICPKHEGKKCGLCGGAGFVTKKIWDARGK